MDAVFVAELKGKNMARYKIVPATDKTSKKVEFDKDLHAGEVATILNCDERTLMRWRQRKAGPAFSRYERKIYYSVESVNKYLADNFYPAA
jgi:hypothetical protein